MKILVLTSSFPRYPGDYQGNFVFHLAQGQIAIGHEVHVVCPHVPGTPFHETMDGVHIRRFPYFFPYNLQYLSSEGGMYSSIRRSPLALFQLPLFVIGEFLCALRICLSHRVDLIHTHWFIPSGIAGVFVAWILKKPHVISSHVLDVNIFGKYRFFLPVLSALVRSTDTITTNSRYTKQQIEALTHCKKPIRVIPMGVTVAENYPGHTRSQNPVILFVGRLVEWKGVDTLIQSMKRVSESITGSRLIIVGTGPSRDSLEHLACDLGLGEKVWFCGRVSNEELDAFYKSAAVFVLPSRTSRGLIMEGLGVVLLEAMSHGIPVIGSRIGGITDIITDRENGFLVPEQDPTALAEKIIALLSDPDLAEKFSRKGFDTVKSRFSWESVSRDFSAMYSDVVEFRGIPGKKEIQ